MLERLTCNVSVSLWQVFVPTMESMLNNLSKNVSDHAFSHFLFVL